MPTFQETLNRDIRIARAGPLNPSPTQEMIGGQNIPTPMPMTEVRNSSHGMLVVNAHARVDSAASEEPNNAIHLRLIRSEKCPEIGAQRAYTPNQIDPSKPNCSAVASNSAARRLIAKVVQIGR